MRILLGPPGSGKTTLLLEKVRELTRAGRGDFRFLTPTATMAEHIRNQLAREGLLVRSSTITTLAGLLAEIVPGACIASVDDLRMLTAQALDELRPRALEPLRGAPNLPAALSQAADELAGAGCGPAQWTALRSLGAWSAPRYEALGEIYEDVERRLRLHGLVRRSALLAEAARRVRESGCPGIHDLFFDGFFTFAPFELQLLVELARHARVTVALPAWEGSAAAVERLRQAGAQTVELTPVRASPESVLCAAPNEQREAEEIALRLIEARGQGYAWRDCGIIMRSPEPYGPLLETTLSRFGIPWRSYFAAPLLGHSAARCLAGLVDARVTGWEHEATLTALGEPACRAARAPGFVGFERKVREELPGQGLPVLVSWADESVRPVLQTLDTWSRGAATRTPAGWLATLPLLAEALLPPAPGNEDGGRGPAVRQFLRTAESAARLLPADPLTLEEFWTQVRPAFSETGLRDPGRRRDAVHLIDAYEARQWELPVVFICGLVEGGFPKRAHPDPVLTDDLRLRLRQQGVPVALASERDAAERFVLEIACTRATRRAVLTWPRFNEAGEEQLRSIALDAALARCLPFARDEQPRRVRVRARVSVPPLPPPSLDDHHLRENLALRYPVHHATALESFLQCPFQFFLRHTAGLNGEPETPAGRLNPLFTGMVLHEVLKNWHQGGGDMAAIFESVWRRALARHRVPAGHAVEFQRGVLRRSLLRYADGFAPEPGWRIHVEQEILLELDGCKIKGRIDRFDVNGAGEVRVYDYKFTTAEGLKRRQHRQDEGLSLQGGLYLLALERQGYRPQSFAYIGLKNDYSERATADQDQVALLMEQARENAEWAAAEILNGRISVNPSDPQACQWCEFLHACRIQSMGAGEQSVEAAG